MWSLIDIAKAGRSIVLTTHSMEEADALCGRIGIMAYGQLRCLGSSLHLKAKFGAGHKVDLIVRDGAREAAIAFMNETLVSRGAPPPTTMPGSTSSQLTVQVRHDAVQLSDLFGAMNERPESSGIVQWALRQTSMEEVFLTIARESEADFAAKEEARKAAKTKGGSLPCPGGRLQSV